MSSDDLVRRLRDFDGFAARRESYADTMLDAAERIAELEATLKRQQISYEREREIDEERIEALEHERSNDLNVMQQSLDALGACTAALRERLPCAERDCAVLMTECATVAIAASSAAAHALRARLK
jgi:hypothetical protein